MQNKPSPTLLAYMLLSLTALIWGCNSVAGKAAVGHISPLLLTALRWALAFGIALAISIPQIRRDWPVLVRQWYIPVLLGAIGYAGFNGFLYSSLQHTSAINALILQAGVPAMIFIVNFAVFHVKVQPAQILGFFITLAGVLVTAARGDLEVLVGLTLNRGDLLMLGGVLVYALYTVGLRWKPAIHWKSMITFAFAGALVASLPMSIMEFQQGDTQWPDVNGWAMVIFAGIFPSLVSQTLYIRGVELIGANRAGLFVNMVPIFGTLLSVFVLGEALQTYHIVGLALVLGGIAFAERKRRQ